MIAIVSVGEDTADAFLRHCAEKRAKEARIIESDGSTDSMTEAEKERLKDGTPKETIAERIWNKRPDGFAIKMPTTTKAGEFVILDFKRMSCVTDQYVTRAKNVAVAQYASIKSALERTLSILQGPGSRHRIH